jgi:hypothetical protein
LNEVLEAAGNIHTTNHVDHSYSYSSPTENPDVKEPEKIQSTPYF